MHAKNIAQHPFSPTKRPAPFLLPFVFSVYFQICTFVKVSLSAHHLLSLIAICHACVPLFRISDIVSRSLIIDFHDRSANEIETAAQVHTTSLQVVSQTRCVNDLA